MDETCERIRRQVFAQDFAASPEAEARVNQALQDALRVRQGISERRDRTWINALQRELDRTPVPLTLDEALDELRDHPPRQLRKVYLDANNQTVNDVMRAANDILTKWQTGRPWGEDHQQPPHAPQGFTPPPDANFDGSAAFADARLRVLKRDSGNQICALWAQI